MVCLLRGIPQKTTLRLIIVMSGIKMSRIVEYNRHEYNDSEKREARLIYFIYDIPYFGGCGILPPLHIINQIFKHGGDEGGMSPGATWNPFEISEEEYNKLVEDVFSTDLEEIAPFARYAEVKFKIDNSFDHIKDMFDWISATCEKHRADWHKELKRKGIAG